MLFKLAMRNVRRSVRDYAIYFVTILFGVAIFYSFNSIGEQRLMLDLESSTSAAMFDSSQVFIAMFSVVVAFVLGFLVLYANRLLIRRRKHEFGIYLTLGMSPGSISRIVLYETVLVGFASLLLGLALGFLLSQLLSFFTAALFQITLGDYRFVFSVEAFVLTIVCFTVIYLVVTLFNVATVNRFKLIDLLSASARNEKVTIRSPWACLVVFVVSVGLLAGAYYILAVVNRFVFLDLSFWAATVLMLVGTLLFFWSLAGFAVAVITRLRGVYLRGLVPFTVRQIASKMNTAFLSLWVVCVLLFFAFTTFSIGMGLITIFVGDIEAASPYDATLKSAPLLGSAQTEQVAEADPDRAASYADLAAACEAGEPEAFALGQAYDWDMEAYLKTLIPNWDDIVRESAQLDSWEVPGVTYGDLTGGGAVSIGDSDGTSAILGSAVGVVALSQYNGQLALQGKPGVDLDEGEYLISNNMEMARPLVDAIVAADPELPILGETYSLASEQGSLQYENGTMLSGSALIVVPDAAVDAMRAAGAVPEMTYLNVMYPEAGVAGDNALGRALAGAFPVPESGSYTINGRDVSEYVFQSHAWPVRSEYTRQEMVDQAKGFRLLISYLALYIGLVFLIATAAVLAIQQVSQTIDSEGRYRLLSKIGSDQRMLSRSLLAQVLIYFLAPLGLALCHSACAITTFNASLLDPFGYSALEPILFSAALVAVVYGGYMVVTYLVARLMVKGAVKAK